MAASGFKRLGAAWWSQDKSRSCSFTEDLATEPSPYISLVTFAGVGFYFDQ
jgi:hypothetical protein